MVSLRIAFIMRCLGIEKRKIGHIPNDQEKHRDGRALFTRMGLCYNESHMTRKKKLIKDVKPKAAENVRKPAFSLGLTEGTKRSIAAVFCMTLALVFVLGFLEQAGAFGEFLDKRVSGAAFGWGKWIFPFLLLFSGYVLIRKSIRFPLSGIIGLSVSFLTLLGVFHAAFFPQEEFLSAALMARGGGYVGYFMSMALAQYVGAVGAVVIFGAICFVGVMIAFNVSLVSLAERLEFLRNLSFSFDWKAIGRRRSTASDNVETVTGLTDHGDNGAVDGGGNRGWDDPTLPAVDERNSGKTVSDGPQIDSGGTLADETLAKNNIREIRWTKERSPESSKNENPVQSSDIPAYVPMNNAPMTDASYSQRSVSNRIEKTRLHGADLWEFWRMPPLDILERSGKKAKAGNIEERKRIIAETLAQFGIDVEPADAKVGPTVTQYSFRPGAGVKLEKITALGSNLAMALSAHPIRIEAPIPKTSFVGVEVPNFIPEQVRLRDMIESEAFQKSESDLTIALGKDVNGDFVFGHLEKMPHLMVAGSTGSGKSVCINSILISLLYKNSPEQLKLILVDPKRVELSLYSRIPHLIHSVVTENKKAVGVLKWAVNQMESRYRILEESQTKSIQSYNDRIRKKRKQGIENDTPILPYIVIVIDELSDLMSSHGKQVEGAIVRLAQMARAVGIHLIVSTQRPSVSVVTGLIKNNITNRIAFKVGSQIDSRTILDRAGSEKLLGNGDMLFVSGTDPMPKRVQGVYASENEVKKVVAFIRDQDEQIRSAYGDRTESQDSIDLRDDFELPGQQQNMDFDAYAPGSEQDSKYEEAKAAVLQKGTASTSYIQRALRIGYNHAAGLIDELERKGVIGPANGSKPREVYGHNGNHSLPNQAPHKDESPDSQAMRDRWGA